MKFDIENGALFKCIQEGGETDVIVPEGVTVIAEDAFDKCWGVTSVVLPQSLEIIRKRALELESVRALTIPKGVVEIEEGAIGALCRAKSLTVEEGNPVYHSAGNCVIETKTGKLIAGCPASVIPQDGSVLSIEASAFGGCSIGALHDVQFRQLTIPESVQEISWLAFNGMYPAVLFNESAACCAAAEIIVSPKIPLEEYDYPDADRYSYGDYGCYFSAVLGFLRYPERFTGVIKSGYLSYVLRNDKASLSYIFENDLPQGLALIASEGLINARTIDRFFLTPAQEADAFGCIAFLVDWANGHISAEDRAREEERRWQDEPGAKNWIYKETIEGMTVEFCDLAFSPASGEESEDAGELAVPETIEGVPVTVILDGAFRGCGMRSVRLPRTLKRIGAIIFDHCLNLRSITLPAGVSFADAPIAVDCPQIESMTVEEGNPAFHSEANCIIETKTRRMIAGCKNSVIPPYVEEIGEKVFFACSGLEKIDLPHTLKAIGECAFYKTSLSRLSIPKSVVRLGERFAMRCAKLESLTVEKGNPEYVGIGNCVISTRRRILFAGCKNSVIPPNGAAETIGPDAFRFCDFERIEIPEGVVGIGEHAFSDCPKLKTVVLPHSVHWLGEDAFNGCGALQTIEIPEEVGNIGNFAIFPNGKLTVYTPAGSAADVYCRYNGISVCNGPYPYKEEN